jgi:hypothetical protein
VTWEIWRNSWSKQGSKKVDVIVLGHCSFYMSVNLCMRLCGLDDWMNTRAFLFDQCIIIPLACASWPKGDLHLVNGSVCQSVETIWVSKLSTIYEGIRSGYRLHCRTSQAINSPLMPGDECWWCMFVVVLSKPNQSKCVLQLTPLWPLRECFVHCPRVRRGNFSIIIERSKMSGAGHRDLPRTE